MYMYHVRRNIIAYKAFHTDVPPFVRDNHTHFRYGFTSHLQYTYMCSSLSTYFSLSHRAPSRYSPLTYTPSTGGVEQSSTANTSKSKVSLSMGITCFLA